MPCLVALLPASRKLTDLCAKQASPQGGPKTPRARAVVTCWHLLLFPSTETRPSRQL